MWHGSHRPSQATILPGQDYLALRERPLEGYTAQRSVHRNSLDRQTGRGKPRRQGHFRKRCSSLASWLVLRQGLCCYCL